MSSKVDFLGVVTTDFAWCFLHGLAGQWARSIRSGWLDNSISHIFSAFSRRSPAYDAATWHMAGPTVMDFFYSLRQMYNGGHLIWRFIWYESYGMVLVLGDAGDTHFDWRSSLEQDRSRKVLWGSDRRRMGSRVDSRSSCICGSDAVKHCSREGSHLGNNKTIIFFFSGGTEMALVQLPGTAFSFRVPNPSLYWRFWSVAGSDKRVWQQALEEASFERSHLAIVTARRCS